MRGIDDWYLAHGYLDDLHPKFGPDDDITDPHLFGETPAREWVVGTGKRQSGQKSRTIRQADGPRTVPPARSGGSWQSAAREWLTTFPQGTNRECQRALRQAGHLNASTQLIERLRAGMPTPASPKPSKAAGNGGGGGTVRRHFSGGLQGRVGKPGRSASHHEPVVHATPELVKINYCEGCGIAVGDDGFCRC